MGYFQFYNEKKISLPVLASTHIQFYKETVPLASATGIWKCSQHFTFMLG